MASNVTNHAVYVDATPDVTIGEVSSACAIDGLPLVIVEDKSGDGLDGGPFRVTLSVPAAQALADCLLLAIEAQRQRHPELREEKDDDEFAIYADEEDDEEDFEVYPDDDLEDDDCEDEADEADDD